MERVKRFWGRFKSIAIVFSFVVNFVMVVTLLVLTIPALQTAFALKTGLAEPLLDNLDAAFVGLGDSTIASTIHIDQPATIRFDLPLDQPLPIDFPLSIEQDTVVTLTAPVPLILPATFNLPGGGGSINGTVNLSLPAGTQLPIHLSMVVPVQATIPVQMRVPVDQNVPIQMDVPINIRLGESGLAPAVEQLRAVFRPLRSRLERLPDGIALGGE